MLTHTYFKNNKNKIEKKGKIKGILQVYIIEKTKQKLKMIWLIKLKTTKKKKKKNTIGSIYTLFSLHTIFIRMAQF